MPKEQIVSYSKIEEANSFLRILHELGYKVLSIQVNDVCAGGGYEPYTMFYIHYAEKEEGELCDIIPGGRFIKHLATIAGRSLSMKKRKIEGAELSGTPKR